MFGGLVFLALVLALYVLAHGAAIVYLLSRPGRPGGRVLIPLIWAALATPVLGYALYSPWGADPGDYDNFDAYRLITSPLLAFGVAWCGAFACGFWASMSKGTRKSGASPGSGSKAAETHHAADRP